MNERVISGRTASGQGNTAPMTPDIAQKLGMAPGNILRGEHRHR